MKIHEIAKKLNLSPRAIRFYEEKGLISPHKHPHNGYREFTESDAWRLQTIMALREVGVAVEDIKKALDPIERGDKHEVQHFLELQRSIMFSQWVELKQMIETMDRLIELLNREQSLTPENLHELAERSKRLRQIRSNWHDRWDFDQQALSYDERMTGVGQPFHTGPEYEKALDRTVERVSPAAGEIGLDIGTGTGNLAGRFLDKGIRMIGIDQSREMLNRCRRKYPQMETKVGNFLAVPFFDGHFDFIVTSFALHHLTDEQKPLALAEMDRVLKPHGRICITDYMFENSLERARYMERLKAEERWDALRALEDEYYADRSQLLQWLEGRGYIAKYERLNELLHIVYAVRIR